YWDDMSPAQISKRMSGAWSATFEIVYSSGSKPVCGQEVGLFWNSVKRFGGIVQTVAETRIKGPANVTRLLVTCTGYQGYLNRTVAAKLYTLTTSGWPIIIYDLWYDHLKQFGITLNYPQGPLTGFEPLLLHYIYIAEVFNRIRDENAGWDYWISDNKELLWYEQGTGPAAAFTLRDGDVNQDAVTVTRSNTKFRNKQWVLPSVSLTTLKVESTTATAGQTVFETVYAQMGTPIVTLDTGGGPVAQAVTTLGNWDGSPWFYIVGGIGVFRSPGAAAIGAGDIVEVSYPNPFPIGYSAQDDASIAAVGLYESVYQAKNVVDEATAVALAQAILDAFGTNGDFPESVKFQYNSQSQSAWLLPGDVVDVDRTFPDATGNYVVEEIQISLEKLRVWRHSVTLRLGQGDVSATFENDFLTSGRLWVNSPPVRVTIELDLTGAGNVVGVQPQFYTMQGGGLFVSWDMQFESGFEPTGEDFIMDVTMDGASIFPTGDANKIVVPEGSTAQATGFAFVSANLAFANAQKLKMNIIQAAGTSYGVGHLNLMPNTALPPA